MVDIDGLRVKECEIWPFCYPQRFETKEVGSCYV